MSENFTGTWRTREESFLKDQRKSQIRKKSIVFLGHFISSEDIQVDHPKTEANSKMYPPWSVTELQRFPEL